MEWWKSCLFCLLFFLDCNSRPFFQFVPLHYYVLKIFFFWFFFKFSFVFIQGWHSLDFCHLRFHLFLHSSFAFHWNHWLLLLTLACYICLSLVGMRHMDLFRLIPIITYFLCTWVGEAKRGHHVWLSSLYFIDLRRCCCSSSSFSSCYFKGVGVFRCCA